MLRELRLAVRGLRRHPTFASVAVLTLALGLGANLAIFSVIDGVLLRTLPFEAVDRLVMVWETDRDSGTVREPASVPDFLDFERRSRQVESFGALMGTQVTAFAERGAPVRLAALAVTDGLLPLLGIDPVVGRGFTAAETAPGGPSVAIISHAFWTERFDRDPDIVGRVVPLDAGPATIVGVVPDDTDLGVLQILSAAAYARAFADRGTRTDVDVWVPLQADLDRFPRSTHPIFVVGRLAPGATVATAADELAAIAANLERAYPENDARGVFVEPLAAVVFGPVRGALAVLLAAVALLLLVACANVANLLLAHATARLGEVAVRQALGADLGRLARQFCAESLVLTTLATGLACGAALVGLRLLLAWAPADVPRLDTVALDLRVLGVAVGLALAVGVVFGMLPVAQAWRIDLQAGLRGRAGSAGFFARGARLPRRLFVVAQVALAVLLVVGAGLLLRSFQQLQAVDPGFRAGGVLKAEYHLPAARYRVDGASFPDFPEVHAFTGELLRDVTALPGVRAAAVAGSHPLDPGATNSFVVVGREAEAADWPEITVRRVTPGYFETVGLGLVDGRAYGESDDAAAPAVAVINVAAARRFFGERSPLGHQLGFWGARRTIVGVVGNERVQGLATAPPPSVYLPLAQAPSFSGDYALLARVDGDPAALAPTVARVVARIDPQLAMFGLEPLDETLARSLAARRFVTTLLGLFAAVAVGLATVGLYGVLSYDVARRTREIGVRLAVGARPARIVAHVVREGLGLAAAGLGLGLVAAVALTRLLSTLLFGIAPLDAVTFAAAPVLVLAVATAASLLPARRAAAVDPATALRDV